MGNMSSDQYSASDLTVGDRSGDITFTTDGDGNATDETGGYSDDDEENENIDSGDQDGDQPNDSEKEQDDVKVTDPDIEALWGQIDDGDECSICLGVRVLPIKAPACTHTFCKLCFYRAAMINHTCPLCRKVDEFDYALLKVDVDDEERLQKRYPVPYAKVRAEAAHEWKDIKKSLKSLTKGVLLFVMGAELSSGMMTGLHLFEPRYRILVERALETPTKSFGWVCSGGAPTQGSYGYMCTIARFQRYGDGGPFDVSLYIGKRFKIKTMGFLSISNNEREFPPLMIADVKLLSDATLS